MSIGCRKIPEQWHGQFDAIIMNALIEHLIDPLRAMQGIRKLLRPGGLVYIDTPNLAKFTRQSSCFWASFHPLHQRMKD